MTGRARGRAERRKGTESGSECGDVGLHPPRQAASVDVMYQRSPPRVGSGDEASAAVVTKDLENMSLCSFATQTTLKSSAQTLTGTSGKPITLVSNLFRLDRTTDFRLFQYHVDFVPDIPNKKMRQSMMHEHKETLGGIYMFDGMILFLPVHPKQLELASMRNVDKAPVQILLKLTNEIPPSSPICMQLYNIVFKRLLSMLHLIPIGRNYYSSTQAFRIADHKLEVWPGFVTSILQFEKSAMLCVDLSHKVINTETVLTVMQAAFSGNASEQSVRDKIAKQVVGEIVLTKYNNRTYRIDDIDWGQNPQSIFTAPNIGEMSYEEYYWKNYKLKISDRQQPLLISMPKSKEQTKGQKQPICLVPELCLLTGLSEQVRTNFRVMKEIADQTRLGPQERIKVIEGLLDKIAKTPEAVTELSNWHLEFARKLLTIPSRQLLPEKIFTHSKEFTYKQFSADWASEMRNEKLRVPVDLNKWILIFPSREGGIAKDFISVLDRVCPSFGMNVSACKAIETPNDSINTLLSALKMNVRPDTELVVCLLSTSRKDCYDAIKVFCCIDNPVPSQVIVSRTLSKKQMQISVVTKIALQLNCKLGGELWSLDIPVKNTMVVGIDCYRDSSKRGRTVGAFVATMNTTFTRYYSRCTFQTNMEDLIVHMKLCMMDALKAFYSVNGHMPEKIVIYRDGVGDGQLKSVLEQEVNLFLKCFMEAGDGYNPKFAMIIVKKRINSRFFLYNNNQSVTNPLPGTVVDTEATRPEWYDFFLVSQSVRQGTVSPTHYNVIHDSLGLKADHLQRLTYKLCHLYYNWQGTIRVPAVCQYAHKLAFLVGQSLHRDPSTKLADKLFYL